VGTPPDEDGSARSANFKYVLKVAETIDTYMQYPKVIIDKSTITVALPIKPA
jgi:UDPglucose 6-dehydrogenase